jgi:hypothetical protein
MMKESIMYAPKQKSPRGSTDGAKNFNAQLKPVNPRSTIDSQQAPAPHFGLMLSVVSATGR